MAQQLADLANINPRVIANPSIGAPQIVWP
jgi:hypothetical protein